MSRPIIGQLAAAALVLALAVTGCGASTQRAAVSAEPAPASALLDVKPAGKDYVVDTSRSKFEVWGKDIMSGDHRISFGSWRARVRTEPVPTIAAEIDMFTAKLDKGRGTGTLRRDLLEADRFPHSTLDATMKKTGRKAGEHVVEGVTELHGVRKRLRFTGQLTQDGETFHFTAEFVISRKTFGIHYAPAEPFLKDDVRVVIDVIAVPAALAPVPEPPPDPPEPPPESSD